MIESIFDIVETTKMNIGFYITDFKNEYKYNENKLFETASCIKIYILIEFYNQVYKKIIDENAIIKYKKEDNIKGLNSGVINIIEYGTSFTLKDYIKFMIVYSDNIATNKLIDILGIDNINNTIKNIGLKNTKLHNKLDLLKYLKFGTTTPYKYALTYKMLLEGKIINKNISNKMNKF